LFLVVFIVVVVVGSGSDGSSDDDDVPSCYCWLLVVATIIVLKDSCLAIFKLNLFVWEQETTSSGYPLPIKY
jgi:hypothetical protein